MPKREMGGARIEEIIIYSLLIIAGAVPVWTAVQTGGYFGVEPTIGFILIGLGLLGFLFTLLRRRSMS
jgi:LPXTG-motif cell wall-anchored protein